MKVVFSGAFTRAGGVSQSTIHSANQQGISRVIIAVADRRHVIRNAMKEKTSPEKSATQFPESALRSTLPRLADNVPMSVLRQTSQIARDSAVRSARFDVYGIIPASGSRITPSGVSVDTSVCSSVWEAGHASSPGPPRRGLLETNAGYALRLGRKASYAGDSRKSSGITSPDEPDGAVSTQTTSVGYSLGSESSGADPRALERRHARIGKNLSWLEKRYQDDNCTSVVPTYAEVVRWLQSTHDPCMDSTTILSQAEILPWVEVEWRTHMSLGGRNFK